jgi:hypothetical protein
MELIKKLIEVSKAIGYLQKDKTNKMQGYNYLSEAKIKETIKAEFEKQGIVFNYSTDEVREYEISPTSKGTKQFCTIAKGTYHFYDNDNNPSGNVPVGISGTWFGSGTDTGDKGLYKAITGGIKYVLNTNFLIPTGDDPENDNGHDNGNTVKPKVEVDPDIELKKQLVKKHKGDKAAAKAEYDKINAGKTTVSEALHNVVETEAELDADMENYFKDKLKAVEV